MKSPSLLFLHIPKTAGTSIRRFLADQYCSNDILPADSWQQVAKQRLDPCAFALAAGHFRYNFRTMVAVETKLLILLREPLARFISDLRHAKRDPQFDPNHEQIRAMSFADIIRTPELSQRRGLMQCSWLAANADVATVSAYLALAPSGDPADVEEEASPDILLRRATAHLEEVDFIGFAEDLPMVIDQLCGSLQFHPPARLPVDNVASADDTTTGALRPDDLSIIRRLTEPDRELYAFAWRLCLRRRRQGRVIDMARTIPGISTGFHNELVIEPGMLRRFSRDDLGSRGMIGGWSRPEDGHTWNDGVEMAYALTVRSVALDATLELAGSPYIRPSVPAQDIIVDVNGLRIFSRRLTSPDDVVLAIPLLAEWWCSDGQHARLRIEIRLPHSVCPRDIGDGADARQLGFAFHSLRLRVPGG